jgi:hypothetical protein
VESQPGIMERENASAALYGARFHRTSDAQDHDACLRVARPTLTSVRRMR